jgi:hypothetical protein
MAAVNAVTTALQRLPLPVKGELGVTTIPETSLQAAGLIPKMGELVIAEVESTVTTADELMPSNITRVSWLPSGPVDI